MSELCKYIFKLCLTYVCIYLDILIEFIRIVLDIDIDIVIA